MDCVTDLEVWLAARHNELANVDNEPGNVLRTRLQSLQRLTGITNEDPEVCADTTQALKATITIPTLRMNSMDLHEPFMRPDFEEALGLIPSAIVLRWQDVKAKQASRQRRPSRHHFCRMVAAPNE